MEKDIFRCVCEADVSMPDGNVAVLCPRCGRTITRKDGNKVRRENLPPHAGISKVMK